MENNNVSDSSPKDLVNELIEGRDLTKKLQLGIHNEPHSSKNEAYGSLAKNILAKFERSLQILQYDPTTNLPSQFQQVTNGTNDSPTSFSGSPKSQDSDGDFKDPTDHQHKDDSKKRRVDEFRVTRRMQGSTSSGLEGPVEDGYNWRKYGQKDILGTKYPRAYYRCTFKNLNQCSATKQVQRADDDPSFFVVTYRGKHSCSQAASSSSPFPNNLIPKLEPLETLATSPPQQPHPHHEPKEYILDFNQHNNNHVLEDIKPIINHFNQSKPFSFSYPSSSSNNNNNTTMQNYCDNFGNFPTKTSTTYTTTYQSPSSCLMVQQSNFNDHTQGAYYHHQEGVVNPSSTSATNSPPIAPPELTFDNNHDQHQGEFNDFDYYNSCFD